MSADIRAASACRDRPRSRDFVRAVSSTLWGLRTLVAPVVFGVTGLLAMSSAAQAAPIKNIVLVHGAFADGSGWRGVYDILRADGYNVAIVQEPETSLADDVAATRRAIDRQAGPVILVGHSYGGVVITEAGNHPQVKGLVYVAAIAPDANENVGALRATFPPATNPIVSLGDGFVALDPQTFAADFAADVPEADARFMAASQVPIATQALTAQVHQAAWHTRPTWYVVASNDHKINPDFERFLAKRANATTIEIPASHAVYVSHPQQVAKLIEDAAMNAEK